jgi:hypothetical protein
MASQHRHLVDRVKYLSLMLNQRAKNVGDGKARFALQGARPAKKS